MTITVRNPLRWLGAAWLRWLAADDSATLLRGSNGRDVVGSDVWACELIQRRDSRAARAHSLIGGA